MKDRPILVVDDEPTASEYLALALGAEFRSIRRAGNGVEALLAVEAGIPDLIVSDLHMPDMDGLELLCHIRVRWPGIAFILVTVEGDVATIVEAVQCGVTNYLVKPVAPAALCTAARKALRSRARPCPSDRRVPELIGISPSAVLARHLIAVAACADVNILITGETGTGKELVARAVHRLSHPAPGPFVAQNCSLIPRDLFESEFFGHKRGAFTGADRDQLGLLQQAHRGMLLLDELECLTLPHQSKLLRVLDDGVVRPVGGHDSVTICVRFLAATNQEPARLLACGRLREDLYYRLRGIEIALAPLRERREDIPLLALHFLGGTGREFTPEALDALCGHPWPGNVRELRNTVRRAAAMTPGRTISARDLCLDAGEAKAATARRDALPSKASGVPELRSMEREAIVLALQRFGGNRSQAARALGIDRSTLRRKLHHLGLDAADQGS